MRRSRKLLRIMQWWFPDPLALFLATDDSLEDSVGHFALVARMRARVFRCSFLFSVPVLHL